MLSIIVNQAIHNGANTIEKHCRLLTKTAVTCFFIMLISVSFAVKGSNLVILTTFSEAPLSTLIKSFNSQYPDVFIKVIYRRTKPSLQLLKDTRGQPIDLVLTSSPFLINHLLSMDKIKNLSTQYPVPKWLQHSILLPSNKISTIGYSGAGVVWSPRYFKLHQLPIPHSVLSLLNPIYFGHLIMSTPSRSGTTQLMIESILTKYGWNKGWNILLRLSANLATISSRSFGVSHAIAAQRVGAGITIDSYPMILNQTDQQVQYINDSDFTIMPAYISVMADSENVVNGKLFMAFLFSEKQQKNMHQSGLLKYSIKDLTLKSFKPLNLDINVMAQRELGVNLLFDLLVTQRLSKLQEIQKKIIKLDEKYPDSEQVKNGVKQANLLAFNVPIRLDEFNASTVELNNSINNESSDAALQRDPHVIAWSYKIAIKYKRNLMKASNLLSELMTRTEENSSINLSNKVTISK